VRIEPHRLGIDCDGGTEREAVRQVMPMQMDGAAGHELRGAQVRLKTG
jgi:hypothetical protein